METAADELAPLVGRKRACAAVGLSRAGWYRRHRQSAAPATPPAPPVPHRAQPRALSAAERDELNAVLHEERFVDLAPAEIYATLLDEGRYIASISSMYRELHRRHGQVPERRRQASHPAHAKPELRASGPNELWSWDVSKLRGPGKWNWFYLYWILDVYSRYAVGWCISEHETAAISERLITDTIGAHGVDATALTIHADRGPQQTAKPVAQLYADLGITRSHSRPRVSNDNPYSEAGFKTFKYRPDFPGRFDSLEAAVAHGDRFFDWYNLQHHHWGLELLTPAQVHHGQVDIVIEHRQHVLDTAHATHPERFVRRPPIAKRPPDEAWINRPPEEDNSTH
jgi:putative transposase